MTYYTHRFSQTSCVSEAQRYEGKLYKPKAAKSKKNPQEIWTEVVEKAASDISSAPQPLRQFLGNLTGYGNVPRNEKKFINFVKNSLNVRSDKVTSELWAYLSAAQTAAQAAQDAELGDSAAAVSGSSGVKRKKEEDAEPPAEKKRPKVPSDGVAGATVDWGRAISKALKAAPGRQMSLKALRKAAAALVSEQIEDLSKGELKAAFKAALASSKKVSVDGEGSSALVSYLSQ